MVGYPPQGFTATIGPSTITGDIRLKEDNKYELGESTRTLKWLWTRGWSIYKPDFGYFSAGPTPLDPNRIQIESNRKMGLLARTGWGGIELIESETGEILMRVSSTINIMRSLKFYSDQEVTLLGQIIIKPAYLMLRSEDGRALYVRAGTALYLRGYGTDRLILGVGEVFCVGVPFKPYTDNALDLGSSTNRWRDGFFSNLLSVRRDSGDYGGNFANYTPPTGREGALLVAEDTNAVSPGRRLYVYSGGAWRYVDLLG